MLIVDGFPDWKKYFDHTENRYYYFHPETEITQWDPPSAAHYLKTKKVATVLPSSHSVALEDAVSRRSFLEAQVSEHSLMGLQ